eukprot:1176297-Prorocentrum_minimum.AAC.1
MRSGSLSFSCPLLSRVYDRAQGPLCGADHAERIPVVFMPPSKPLTGLWARFRDFPSYRPLPPRRRPARSYSNGPCWSPAR